MSLEDIRSECSDTAALLQPHVDGELAEAEQERVAAHLECCRPCRAAVSEQQWVRATLRAVEREVAPVSLRSRILIDLDAVDREAAPVVSAPAVKRPGMWSRMLSAVADAGRGALIMVPAGAVAVGLFLVVREGLTPAQTMPGGLGSALANAGDGAAKQAERGAAAPSGRPGASLPPVTGQGLGELQLVRAEVPGALAPAATGARLRYQIVRDGLPTGQHVIDQQAPAGLTPVGTPVEFRGRRFLVDQTSGGEPAVHFELAGVSHRFVLEGGRRDRDFSMLLELIDQELDHGVTRPAASTP